MDHFPLGLVNEKIKSELCRSSEPSPLRAVLRIFHVAMAVVCDLNLLVLNTGEIQTAGKLNPGGWLRLNTCLDQIVTVFLTV